MGKKETARKKSQLRNSTKLGRWSLRRTTPRPPSTKRAEEEPDGGRGIPGTKKGRVSHLSIQKTKRAILCWRHSGKKKKPLRETKKFKPGETKTPSRPGSCDPAPSCELKNSLPRIDQRSTKRERLGEKSSPRRPSACDLTKTAAIAHPSKCKWRSSG